MAYPCSHFNRSVPLFYRILPFPALDSPSTMRPYMDTYVRLLLFPLLFNVVFLSLMT